MSQATVLAAGGYLRLVTLAERLSVHPHTLHRWVADGLPHERTGRVIWIRPADLKGRVAGVVIASLEGKKRKG